MRKCRKFYKDILNKEYCYKLLKRKKIGDSDLFLHCLKRLISKYFPKYEENELFIFVLASLTYHGDFTKRDKNSQKILETLNFKNIHPKDVCLEANDLYSAFYNYSDEKFGNAIKLRPVRVLYKYFVDHSSFLNALRQDDEKKVYLEEFYDFCKNEVF